MSAWNAINKTIYDVFKADGTLTGMLATGTPIYYQQAPDKQTYPFVVFSWQTGNDDNDTPRRAKDMILWARAFSIAGPAQAGSIDARMDTLINGKTLTVSGWSNFYTARETDVALVENLPDNNKVWQAGGMYRIRISE